MPEALQLAIRHHKSPRQTVKLHSSDVVSGTVRSPPRECGKIHSEFSLSSFPTEQLSSPGPMSRDHEGSLSLISTVNQGLTQIRHPKPRSPHPNPTSYMVNLELLSPANFEPGGRFQLHFQLR